MPPISVRPFVRCNYVCDLTEISLITHKITHLKTNEQIESVGLEDLAVLAGTERQKVIERMTLLELGPQHGLCYRRLLLDLPAADVKILPIAALRRCLAHKGSVLGLDHC